MQTESIFRAFADLPFPMSIRNELVKGGRALPHHVLPNSGWITFLINKESDVIALIDLFRMQYERLSNHWKTYIAKVVILLLYTDWRDE